MPNIGKRYYRVDEVAWQLRVSPATVRRWVRRGKLAHVRTPGGSIRIEALVLAEYADGRRNSH